MRVPLRIVGAVAVTSAVAVAVPLLSPSEAQAVRFTGGNLVVYRVGDGGALSNAAAPVFLDEFTPAGSKVQSIAVPTSAANGNNPLTAAGLSRSEGLLAGSPDGRFVTFTGYAAAPGTTGPAGASLTASDPATVKRVVGVVDANGTVDTSTTLAAGQAPAIVRSAATSDGDRLWVAGGDRGLIGTSLAATSGSVVAGDATSNLNAVTVQGGQLFTSGILANRLSKIGSGLPAGSASTTDLAGLPDNLLTYAYAFLDVTGASYAGTGLDTLYVANSSERGGTVDKYRFDGSTWDSVGYVDVDGATGLVADVEGSAVSLAVTTPSRLVTLTDPSGAAASFAAGSVSTLATAAAGTEFRGVALAPTGDPGPSVYVRSPLRGAAVDGNAGTVTVTAYVDSSDTVSSVQAKLGNGTAVDATQGAGDLWTAEVPASGLPTGTTTLTVTATDGDGTTTATRPVELSGVPAGALGAGSYGANNKAIDRSGPWKTYNTDRSPTGKGVKASKKNAKVTFQSYGSQVVLTFETGRKHGKVKVTVGGQSSTLDLYSKQAGTLVKKLKLGSLDLRDVTVKVLGTKAKASDGTLVPLAKVQVKA